MKVDILGVKIDDYTMDEAVKKVSQYINSDKKYKIYTPNPEFVIAANEDEEFKDVLNKGDLVIPDGIGIVMASKIMKKSIKERVAGYDLLQKVFNEIKDTDKTVYLFGAAKGVAANAASKMQQLHKGLNIIGYHDGYFDEDEEKLIMETINSLKPDLLLVGLGAPKQEKWINENINNLNVKVAIGVGGSFDGMAGNVKRAPMIYQKLGLEWFYRLIKQPTRIKRMIKLPMFLIKVIVHRKK
ncbi:N-acetylmannosaminyltransferase [Vallitalea longa]|uniref:N-acetylglucosaminyldiphosphoundecaprenol N-acetyl-beta-D-mannosaminyltransferase n=1 Tax=Vallitalea longa TaxID=2936439 RepID=A0A9W6DER1_9FIRM|nr:WecB/TagA/CpsF family glycosyltransferase [Vallitalea longa]GKX30451.1 N-acetylmannosaminyltransferase [Vallitalea longa]